MIDVTYFAENGVATRLEIAEGKDPFDILRRFAEIMGVKPTVESAIRFEEAKRKMLDGKAKDAAASSGTSRPRMKQDTGWADEPRSDDRS